MTNNFINMADVIPQEKIPGFHGKFIHTERLTFAVWKVEAGAVLPNHNHEHEQVTMVLHGEFEMKVGEETQICTPGMVVTIPSQAFHSGKALTACEIVDIFQPVREDFK